LSIGLDNDKLFMNIIEATRQNIDSLLILGKFSVRDGLS